MEIATSDGSTVDTLKLLSEGHFPNCVPQQIQGLENCPDTMGEVENKMVDGAYPFIATTDRSSSS